MLHTIKNKNLTCTIDSNGAEIRSLIDNTNGREYIWQITPSVWGSSSPVLFPAIGKIKENKITFNGEAYAMPKHGFIRNNNSLSFKSNSISKCTFKLTNSNKTLKQYPFLFSFSIEFSLVNKRLITTYFIENKDTVPMPFSCGGHTAYLCSLNNNIKLSDYVIEFPNRQLLKSKTLGQSGLLSNQLRRIETNENTLELSDTLFDKDALIFSDIEFNWVRLRKKSNNKGIIVRFKNYPHLALWSKPSADFICIEPWLGLPDSENESLDLMNKTSYKTIQPNSKFSISIETEIE